MRKIVIIPAFASSHLLKCWIPNVIEAINPDVIIINEGLFPEGPENKGHIDEIFKAKYCFKDTMLGFDFEETKVIVEDMKKLYPHNIIWLQKTGYTLDDSNKCFLESISRCDITKFKEGDLIFPLEPDAFLLETDKEIIKEEISRLKPGEGLSCKWVDFLETQYYTEAVNMSRHKYRRFCYCFDTMENYKEAMSGFMSQEYPKLSKTNKFFIRHYPWFVYDKWKELRYELIWRKDPKYWQDFEKGLNMIRVKTQEFLEHPRVIDGSKSWIYGERWNGNKIIIRPSRTDEAQWAQFIDIPHPEAIKSHPNFVQ